MDQAALVGPACREFHLRLFDTNRHRDHQRSAAHSLRNMARRYGPERMEAACDMALENECIETRHIRNLLRNRRESIKKHKEVATVAVIDHANLRSSSEFTKQFQQSGGRKC